MSIIQEPHVVVECDRCGYNLCLPATKKKAIATAREEGWSIGKKVLCPECRNKLPSEVSE